MAGFPRTMIENISVPRMIIGSNWFLGFSHTSKAQDDMIKERMTSSRIADVMEVFMNAGVDATLGIRPNSPIIEAITEAEQRTGRKCIRIGTPQLQNVEGPGEIDRTLDTFAELGTDICMPHQATTDRYVNRWNKTLEGIEPILAKIRERGMVPGLSTHMPETPLYADRTGLDVATYIQIYNAAGFLMQIEIDWVNRMIWQAQKPVLTIKPLAAGRVPPLVGLAFSWSTIRDQDMVAIGAHTPDEAREDIDLSLALIERRCPVIELQETRSKESVK